MPTNTEKICETCLITEVLKHPNADRLELAHFELATGPTTYTCVITKGQFKVGDRAVYVGVDSVVPLEGEGSERWQFLKNRLDGKDKAAFRIRAARIRGVFSEGILMEHHGPEPMEDSAYLGQEMWGEWNIGQWEPPVRGMPSVPGVHKTKDPTLGGLFPMYGVDSLKKVPFLFAPGEPVIISEKIHGTNLRCGYLPIGFFGRQRFVVGSHRTIKSDTRSLLERAWHWMSGKVKHHKAHYYGEDVWSQAVARWGLEDKLRQFPDYACYFELYGVVKDGKQIQDLTYGNAKFGMVLLDVYDSDTNTWLTHNELKQVSQQIGVPLFPYLAYTDFLDGTPVLTWNGLEAHAMLAEGNSTMDGAEGQIREGFVARSPTDARRGKLKGQGFLLRQADEMGEDN